MNRLATNLWDRLFGRGPNLPTAAEARWLTEQVSRTPDNSILEESEFQLLFAPDRMMRGCSQYELIQDSAFLAYGYTRRQFNYYMQRDGLPVPMLATSNERIRGIAPPLKIKGELHVVQSHVFAKLDKEKDNLVSFLRQRVQILIPRPPVYKLPEREYKGKPIPLMTGQYVVGAERVEPIWVWMYVGIPEYWDKLLDGGFLFSPVTHHKDDRPWLREYYAMKREKIF